MVPIEVLDEFDNLARESVDDGINLLTGREELNHLLQSAGAVLVQSNLNQAGSSSVHKNGALLVVGELE